MTNSLRIKLAEALGWTEVREVLCEPHCNPIVLLKGNDPTGKWFKVIPDFSRFDSGAALLVGHLRGMGWTRFVLTQKRDGTWSAMFHSETDKMRMADGATESAAIVAAACAVLAIDTSAKG